MPKNKDKLVEVELRLSEETHQYLDSVARLAHVTKEQVINVILAVDTLKHGSVKTKKE